MEQLELGMRLKHREHIGKNINRLVETTNYRRLIAECVRCGVISDAMRSNIEELKGEHLNKYGDELILEQHRQLFIKLTQRGPTAYTMLITALRNLGFTSAIEILESVDDPFISIIDMKKNHNGALTVAGNRPNSDGCAASRDNTDTDQMQCLLKPHNEPIVGQRRIVKKTDKIRTATGTEAYAMRSEHNRGVLLMVNIIEFPQAKQKRNGAEGDGDALIHLFRELGFTIFAYNNLTQEQFFNNLKILIKSDYVRKTESFFLALMTHGHRVNDKDKVEFSDGSIANVDEITQHFKADVCPSLRSKPKVLIFPFCRGSTPDHGHKKIQTDSVGYRYDNVPTLSDILVAYASTPGYETHRDADEGSWYIQKFCDTMAENAHEMHFEDILKITHQKVGNMRTRDGNLQTCAFENFGFNKQLFFNPGYFETDPEN